METPKDFIVADAGSTKTTWFRIFPDGRRDFAVTPGINPVLQDDEAIRHTLEEALAHPVFGHRADTCIYYYGAGCLPDQCRHMEELIAGTTSCRHVEVKSDLWGAARALCGHQAGIACILGTGANSCRFNGTDITRHIAPLGYVLGDEGSGAALGKRLVADILKGLLPEDLRRDFHTTYGWDEADIIRKVYREPGANRFLASFSPFLKAHADHPAVQELLAECFDAFFARNVAPYAPGTLPVHFTGSIAFHFRKAITQAAQRRHLRVGHFVKDPIEGMVKYHEENLPSHPDKTF